MRRALAAALLVLALAAPGRAAAADGDADGDRVPDQSDRCPALGGQGMISGCPRQRGFLLWTSGDDGPGIVVDRLWVQASRGARVDLLCLAHCVRRRVTFTASGRRQPVRAFFNERVHVGEGFVLRVTRPGSVGVYTRAVADEHNLSLRLRCLEPEATVPRARCSGGADGQPSADDVDGDAVADAADACPTIHGEGMISGCPQITAATKLNGTVEHGQLRLSTLVLRTLPGAQVEVTCSRSTTCRPAARYTAHDHPLRVPVYRGLLVPLGTLIEVRITYPGSVGLYIRELATGRGVEATRGCIDPGGFVPREECTGFQQSEPPRPPLSPWLDPFPFLRVQGRPVGRATELTRLRVEHAPRGSTVRVTCRGRGCPYRRRQFAGRRRTPVAGFSGRRLAPGTTIETRVTAPGRVGLYTRIRTRAKKPPLRRERCLLPGASTPSTCPVRP